MDSRMVFRNSIYLGCCTRHRVQNTTQDSCPPSFLFYLLFICSPTHGDSRIDYRFLKFPKKERKIKYENFLNLILFLYFFFKCLLEISNFPIQQIALRCQKFMTLLSTWKVFHIYIYIYALLEIELNYEIYSLKAERQYMYSSVWSPRSEKRAKLLSSSPLSRSLKFVRRFD